MRLGRQLNYALLPLDEAGQKKGREIRAAPYQKLLLTLSTLKSRSTFDGMRVGCLELSRRSQNFRDLRFFGHCCR